MRNVELEIKQIEALYEQTKSLIAQGLEDAAYIYARKITEGILTVLEEKEGIASNQMNVGRLRQIKEVFYSKYSSVPLSVTQLFIYLEKFIKNGNEAAHFKKIKKEENPEYSPNLELDLAYSIITFKDLVQNELPERKVESTFPSNILEIRIKDFQSIKKIVLGRITSNSQFIVFTGNNGDGKTSILQAIVIGILGDFDEQSKLKLCNDDKNIEIHVILNLGNRLVVSIFDQYENETLNVSASYRHEKKNILAYGPSRLQLQSAESQDDERLKQSNIYGLFRTNSILKNISYWLKNQQKERQEIIKTILIKLLPSISEIQITKENGLTFIENGQKLKSDQLSAGNKSILAMIGDMIIRLFDAQPKANSVEELYGIVLIDELETHLHPTWQRELPKLLTTFFPKVQFIISTHSPIVFLGMPKNSVFYNVSRNEKGETEVNKIDIDIENLLPNQILTSPIFGLENIRHFDNKGIENLNVEDTFQEIIKREESKQLLKKLSKNFKFSPQKA